MPNSVFFLITQTISVGVKMLYLLSLIGLLILTPTNWVKSEPYNYPVANPYAATIVGTPKAFWADLPQKIRVKTFELTVFEDREYPDLLWYNEELRYSLAYQKERAPLIFIIAGTGAGYNSSKMQILQRAFFQAGFHVLSLSSPTHPNFIVAASRTGFPGHIVEDSQDLYRVMKLAWHQVQDRIEVSQFFLTGYSLGASQAAFVSKLDEEKRIFNFQKVLLINPAVSLYTSAKILDDMFDQNIPGGKDNVQNVRNFMDRMFHAFSEAYQDEDFVDFSGDFLYAAYKEQKPPEERLEALIGLSFRMSSSSMVFTSDVMTNSGYIKPKNLVLSSTESLSDYGKVAFRVSFLDYFHELFSPYFQAKRPGLTKQALIESLSLKSIDAYLRRAQKISLVTNADDVILAPGELAYLRDVFGTRAKIYPRGGHCGNMSYRDNVGYMTRFFMR